MYLPLLGFAAAAGLLLVRARPAVAVTVVLALTAVSVDRTRVWDSDDSLWREAVRRSPGKLRPKIQLARNVPPAQALPLLADARKVAPDDPAIATETGRILMAQGQTAAALAEFGRALALDPRDARNYNNRGVALAALGQNAAARQDFLRALALDPGLTEAKRNLEMLPAP
jgi:Flp pilus assembly protein TadD